MNSDNLGKGIPPSCLESRLFTHPACYLLAVQVEVMKQASLALSLHAAVQHELHSSGMMAPLMEIEMKLVCSQRELPVHTY